jgi:hypothetical protein
MSTLTSPTFATFTEAKKGLLNGIRRVSFHAVDLMSKIPVIGAVKFLDLVKNVTTYGQR